MTAVISTIQIYAANVGHFHDVLFKVASSNDGRFLGVFSLALPPLCLGGRLAGFGGLWRFGGGFGKLWHALAGIGSGPGGPWRTQAHSAGLSWALADLCRILANVAGFGGLLRPLAVIRENPCGF